MTRSLGLTVCCLTGERPAMVAQMLRPLRDVAAEIVVAMDSRVDPVELGPLLDVADTVVRFEYVDPPERARPWLVELCHHPTVLMIDGDEVPGAELVSALPGMVAASGVEQFRIPRRWCFPDEHHWLAERPWCPDFQRRLVRRGPLLDFDLQVHGGVRAASPSRCMAEPIYHLATLLRPFARRRRRARQYEAQRPGLTAVGGGPMNETLYLPEHFATLRPAVTPEEDAVALHAVLHAPDATEACTAEIPIVTALEVASFVGDDPIEAQGYCARLRIVEHDRRTDPGNDTYLVVEVANTGAAVLPCADTRGTQIRIATRTVDPAAPRGAAGGAIEGVVDGWARTPLACDIAPGDTHIVEALVRVPVDPGLYTVEVDLLNERGRWFECAATADLAVTTRWGRYAL